MELEKAQPRDSSSDNVRTSNLPTYPGEGLSDQEKARIARFVPDPDEGLSDEEKARIVRLILELY